jgi:Fe2+ or Zn2+ uptake regulation protein
LAQEKSRKALNTAGLRVTNQRALILETLRQGHMDADEVYRQACRKQPRLSLSTVYRTLQKLKELGLVDELHFDENHHHYEIKQPAGHHHLVCLGCGKVLEFECPLSQKMKEDVARQKGFEVTATEVHMTGYCSHCRRDRK